VSGVGGNAQIKAMKQVAGRLKLEMAQFREVQAFSQFASDLDKATQNQLRRGQRLTELLKQDLASPYDVTDQIIVIFAGTSGVLDEIPNDKVAEFEKAVLDYIMELFLIAVESILTNTYMMYEQYGTMK